MEFIPENQKLKPSPLKESKFVLTQLPSRFIPYKGITKLYYRPYKYGEVLALSDSKLDLKGKIDVVLSGIEGLGNPYDLILPDLEYISLQRYIASFGQVPKIKLFYTCKKCGIDIAKTLSRDELVFEELKVDKLPFKIKDFSLDVWFTYPNLKKMLEFWNLPEEEQQKDEVKKSLYIHGMSIKEAKKLLLENCTLNDFLTLELLDRYLFCGLLPVKFECEKCKAVYDVIPALGEEGLLILPFRREDQSLRDRIQFE